MYGNKDFNHTIAIVWSVEDIQNIRPDLNNQQSMAVLSLAKEKHDANIGISWDTLKETAHILFPENTDTRV